MTQWKNRIVGYELVPAHQLQAHPYNPKHHPNAQRDALRGSLDTLGWASIITVNKRTNYVIDGHARIEEALTHDDNMDIPVLYVDLSEEEEAQFLVTFDPIGWLAQTDKEQMATLLESIHTDDARVQAFVSGLAEENGLYFGDEPQIPDAPDVQIDRAEELNEKWQVSTGDLWVIPSLTGQGEHRLLCGDSTNAEDVALLMGGDNIIFEFSDPPYELDTIGGGVLKNSAHMKAISDAKIDSFNPSTLKLIAPTSLFCCNKNLVFDYIELARFNKVAWDICFYKKSQTPPNYGGHMMTDTEYLMLLGKQSPNSGLDKETYSKAYLGDRDDDSIVAWQKPVKLVHKFIRLFSSKGDSVIDRFGCTGTTMVACEQLQRQCRMIEIEPKYCAVILERLSAMGCEPRKLN